jgi:hypothetical protein
VKLKVNFLAGGKYYRAGEEVPDEVVPPNFRKRYVMSDDEPSRPPIAKPKRNSWGARKPSKE